MYELQPKRKSILWQYDEVDNNAVIVALGNDKLNELKRQFRDEQPKADIQSKDGIAVKLNEVGTVIWENCDGTNKISDIVKVLLDKFEVEEEVVVKDCECFFQYCNEIGIIDLYWRSLL